MNGRPSSHRDASDHFQSMNDLCAKITTNLPDREGSFVLHANEKEEPERGLAAGKASQDRGQFQLGAALLQWQGGHPGGGNGA